MTGPKRVTDKQPAAPTPKAETAASQGADPVAQGVSRRVVANRANAQKCTGPRTAEGKERSRWNAMKHGILATALIPPSLEPFEMPCTFEALLDGLRARFAPADPVEGMMVEVIAACYWRIARLYCAEGGAAAGAAASAEARRLRHAAEVARLQRDVEALEAAPGTQPVALARRRAELRLQELAAPEPECDRAALPGREDMVVFSRYEAQIQRQLHRALFTLERLQRARAEAPGSGGAKKEETGRRAAAP